MSSGIYGQRASNASTLPLGGHSDEVGNHGSLHDKDAGAAARGKGPPRRVVDVHARPCPGVLRSRPQAQGDAPRSAIRRREPAVRAAASGGQRRHRGPEGRAREVVRRVPRGNGLEALMFVEADLKREVAALGALLGDTRVRFRQGRTPYDSAQDLINVDLEIRDALSRPLSPELQLEVQRLTARLRAIDPR